MKTIIYKVNLRNGQGDRFYFELRLKGGELLIWVNSTKTRAEAKAKAKAVIKEIRGK
jgi:hypothetical protein